MHGESKWKPLPSVVLDSSVFQVETDREVVELFCPRQNVVVLGVHGHFSASSAQAVLAVIEEFREGRSLHLFFEWTSMTSYDALARKLFTDWATSDTSRVEQSWFCSESRLVQMGISVGRMAASIVGVHVQHVSVPIWMDRLARALGEGANARVSGS
ncbi:MAG: hypothetical protein AAGA54_14305 [Myxococcota bacterium]